MNFDLTEEQRAIQKLARDFTEQEIEPIAARIDREGKIPAVLIRKMARLGLFGMTVPRKYGGTEAGVVSSILALEQLGYAGAGCWWAVAMNNSVPAVVNTYGSEEVKRKCLPSLGKGRLQFSILFTEADTGSDPKMLTTTAVAEGDSYLINGTKRFITFGSRDGYATLYAKDDTGRCSCFLIEKNTAGYTTTKTWELMGGGGIEANDVYFENMKVPRENLIGEKGDGFRLLLHWIASEKIEQCAANVGIAQAALDEAITYSQQRRVRDKPISRMQGIQWLLAEMKAKLEAARWLTYRAAFLEENGAPDWMTVAAATKLFVAPATMEVVEMARRIHGGYGYTKEFKIERLYRAAAGASAIAVSLEINKSIVGAALVS